MKKKQETLDLYSPSGEYKGEIDVFNLDISLQTQGYSSISFNIASRIDGETNQRLLDVFDSYEVVKEISGRKHRFIISSTPASMSEEGAITYSYTGLSAESELEKKAVLSWEGVPRDVYYRKVPYKTANSESYAAAIELNIPYYYDGLEEDLMIYEVRKTGNDIFGIRESLMLHWIEGETIENLWARGAYKTIIAPDKQSMKIIIAEYDEKDKKQTPINTEVYYKVYDNPTQSIDSPHYNSLTSSYATDPAIANATYDRTETINGVEYTVDKYYSTTNVTIREIVDGTIQRKFLDEVGSKTRWKISVDNKLKDKRRGDLEINNLTAYQILEKISDTFEAIFIVDSYNRTIKFYEKFEDIENVVQNNLVIDYQTYMRAITKNIEANDIITNLIPIGADGIGIGLVSATGMALEDYSYYLDGGSLKMEDFDLDGVGSITAAALKDDDIFKNFHNRFIPMEAHYLLASYQFVADYFNDVIFKNIPYEDILEDDRVYYGLAERRQNLMNKYVKLETKYEELLSNEIQYRMLKEHIQNSDSFDESMKGTPEYTAAKERFENYEKQEHSFGQAAKDLYENQIEILEKQLFEDYTTNPDENDVFSLISTIQKFMTFLKYHLYNSFSEVMDVVVKEHVYQDNNINEETQLFESSKTYLNENNIPKVTLDISIIDILAAKEAEQDKDNLFLGNYVYVRFEEFNVDEKAQIIGMNIDYDSNEIVMTISTVKRFTNGLLLKMVKNIRGLHIESKNVSKYYQSIEKRSAEETKKITDIFGEGFNADTTKIHAGTDPSGSADIYIDREGIKTTAVTVDAATENLIVQKEGDVTIAIKDGSISLIGNGKINEKPVKTRAMMSVADGFRLDVITEEENTNYKTYDKRFHADMNGNVYIKGTVSANSGDIGGWKVLENQLESKDNGSNKVVLNSSTANGYRFWAGADEGGAAPFSIKSDGSVRATNIIIEGKDNSTANYFKISSDVGNPYIIAGSHDPEKAKFVVDRSGKITAIDGLFKGTIESSFGHIGGWSISGGQLFSGSQDNFVGLSSQLSDPFAIWAGDEQTDRAPFLVTRDGSMKSIRGKIGNWNISEGGIWAGTDSNRVVLASDPQLGFALWAGSESPAKAPFSVQSDGTLKALRGTIGDLIIGTPSYIESNPISVDLNQLSGIGIKATSEYGGGEHFYKVLINAGELSVARENPDEGNILTKMYSHGLVVQQGSSYNTNVDLWGMQTNRFMSLRSGTNLHIDSSGELILSTKGKGLIFLSNDGGSQKTLLRNSSAGTGFSTNVIKKDIAEFSTKEGLEFISNMSINTYNYKNLDKKGISFIIEEEQKRNSNKINEILFEREYSTQVFIKEMLPEWLKPYIGTEAITEYDKHHYSFNPMTYDLITMNGLLVSAIQELEKRIIQLENKLNN